MNTSCTLPSSCDDVQYPCPTCSFSPSESRSREPDLVRKARKLESSRTHAFCSSPSTRAHLAVAAQCQRSIQQSPSGWSHCTSRFAAARSGPLLAHNCLDSSPTRRRRLGSSAAQSRAREEPRQRRCARNRSCCCCAPCSCRRVPSGTLRRRQRRDEPVCCSCSRRTHASRSCSTSSYTRSARVCRRAACKREPERAAVDALRRRWRCARSSSGRGQVRRRGGGAEGWAHERRALRRLLRRGRSCFCSRGSCACACCADASLGGAPSLRAMTLGRVGERVRARDGQGRAGRGRDVGRARRRRRAGRGGRRRGGRAVDGRGARRALAARAVRCGGGGGGGRVDVDVHDGEERGGWVGEGDGRERVERRGGRRDLDGWRRRRCRERGG